ncbi:MAG: hypothetical protein Ct9H300mP27_07720 [Chloroflexota bacterium]|nr:MAG: hypothetical protein Ct9H300mP27_07720 [Chloroflexota bacterium]
MGGAQIINLEKIENFPGFPEGIAGGEIWGPSRSRTSNGCRSQLPYGRGECFKLVTVITKW